jgi:hypothetical protein
MKLKLVSAVTILLASAAFSANAQLKEVSGFQNPESVIGYGDKLFVSNLGAVLDPTAKDGDGFISMLSRKDGKILEEKFISGLNSPKGLGVGWGKIAVTDVDRIIVFDIKTRKKVWEADLTKEGITYANDLTMQGFTPFVSSTDKNAIYKVCHKGTIKKLKVKGDLPGANGLARGCGKIFVANYGRGTTPDGSFGKINRCTKKYKAFQMGGVYDGIAKIGHRLVVTDWVNPAENKGRVVVYNLCKKKSGVVTIGRTIDGPADLYADCKTKTVWVPAMRENKLLGISYAEVKKATPKKADK